MTVEDLDYVTKKVTRHEVIHAFMYESGLDCNSDYARNEELIDWIAIQFEKMLDVFVNLDAIQTKYLKEFSFSMNTGELIVKPNDLVETIGKAIKNKNIGVDIN